MEAIMAVSYNLLNFTAIAALFIYLLSRNRSVVQFVSSDKPNMVGIVATILVLAIPICLASKYSMDLVGGKTNVRDVIALYAAIVGGPAAGVGVGIIGGLYRITLGGWTAVPCTIATITGGFVAAGLYSELQTYKHLAPNVREEKIKLWTSTYLPVYPQLTTWEFAAAAGSTLGIFVLYAAAWSSKLKPKLAGRIAESYFPWISALHILLDYYIDETEDRLSGDLNFVSYYTKVEDIPQRLSFFLKEAFVRIKNLPHRIFHYTILCGLLAMYLSDPKANTPEKKPLSAKILKSAGTYTVLLYLLCKILRKHKVL